MTPSFKIAFVVFFKQKMKKNSFKTEERKSWETFCIIMKNLKKTTKKALCRVCEIDKSFHTHEYSSEKDLGPLQYLRWSSL